MSLRVHVYVYVRACHVLHASVCMCMCMCMPICACVHVRACECVCVCVCVRVHAHAQAQLMRPLPSCNGDSTLWSSLGTSQRGRKGFLHKATPGQQGTKVMMIPSLSLSLSLCLSLSLSVSVFVSVSVSASALMRTEHLSSRSFCVLDWRSKVEGGAHHDLGALLSWSGLMQKSFPSSLRSSQARP